MINSHVQEAGHLVLFVCHVGVEQIGIPLASAPEYVVGPFELVRAFHGLLDLSSCPGKDVGIGVGSGTVCKTLVREAVRRAP